MAVGIHNAATAVTTLASGSARTLAMGIRSAPDRYLVFSIAIRSNIDSVSAGTVFWQPAGTTTGQQELTFLGAINHATDVLRVEQWGLLAPTVSTAAASRLTFTTNSSAKASYTVQCFERVNQTTPYAGYPSVPTNFGSDSGATLTSPVGETTGFSITTAVGEYVVDVFGSDIAATGLSANNWNTLSDVYLTGKYTTGGSITSNLRMGTSWEVATGASTTMKWKSFVGGSIGFPTGQSGRTYVHCGFPLKPSSIVAPQWVIPPTEVIALGSTSTAIRFTDISDWPTAGSFSLHQALGPTESGVAVSQHAKQFTAHTSTAITAASTYAGTTAAGDGTIFRMIAGDGQTQLGSGSLVLYVPSNALENDVMIITVYSEVAGTTVTAATFNTAGAPTATQIATNTTADIRQTLLYKRLSAADVGTANLSCTITFSATPLWRSASAQLYRGCVTTGAPYVTAGDGAPTTNTGSGTAPVVTGVTTPAADHTVIMSAMKFEGNSNWTSPYTSSSVGERLEFFNQWTGEMVMPTAGATGNQTISASNINGSWSTMAITLIPATSTTTHTKSISSMSAVATTRSVSRLMDNYNRAPTVMSGVATTRTAARKGLPYKRAVTAMNAVATTRTLANVLRFTRNPRAMNAVATTRSVARRATFARAILMDEGYIFVTLDREYINTGTIFPRGVASSRVAPLARITVRKATYKRAVTGMNAVATTRTATRRSNPAKRGVAAMNAVATTRTVARKMAPYKRSVTATSGLARVVSISVSQPTGVVGWVDYQPTIDAPYIFRIEDMPNTFPGCQFNLLVQMRSLTSNQKVYAQLYNHTLSTEVAGSQIETAVPYTTWQQVRSGALGLNSNDYYKVRVGKVNPHAGQIRWAKLAVRDVA